MTNVLMFILTRVNLHVDLKKLVCPLKSKDHLEATRILDLRRN
jgi:hypothetical protein